MSKEAMKQALEALEKAVIAFGPGLTLQERAITALRQALANEALDKKAENARELGLDYEPAQQEFVATDWERIARVQDAKLRAMCNESGGFEKLCEVMDRYEHTSPQPAQQEPVARQYQNRDGVWKDFISEKHYKDTLEDGSWPIRNLYTSAQRTWVGLTDEEIGALDYSGTRAEFVKAIEAKLRSKNNG